jgi:hypothetical protein
VTREASKEANDTQLALKVTALPSWRVALVHLGWLTTVQLQARSQEFALVMLSPGRELNMLDEACLLLECLLCSVVQLRMLSRLWGVDWLCQAS